MEEWREFANCLGVPREVFFDDNPKTMSKSAKVAAKFCDNCIVKQECLNYAVENNFSAGIFGGLNRKQRRIYNKNRSIFNEI